MEFRRAKISAEAPLWVRCTGTLSHVARQPGASFLSQHPPAKARLLIPNRIAMKTLIKIQTGGSLVAAFVLVITAAASPAATKSISLSSLPVAVQQTIKAQLGNAQLGKIEQTEEGDENVYEIEFKENGVARGCTVAANGKLLSRELALSETPEAVQKVI